MDELRRNPEEILKQIKSEETTKKKGTLKIFFGYAAGVGKTFAMLESAHDEKAKGIDVVAGYVEPHERPETRAQMYGLETIPIKHVKHNGIDLGEFDLDAAIERHPQLILVDELAHTNAPGCRNAKRYQDVEELLNLGIDVYTTINVQHIESLHDIVASITGVSVRERIPDSVFDRADQVEIVDIEPVELIERLKSGKVYRKAQAQRAVRNFFTVENLTALREISLRRCADHVNTTGIIARAGKPEFQTEEHILVCISSAPSNAKLIRTAARMAKAFRGAFTGIYVETTDFAEMSEENRDRLRGNMRLAEQLGGKIEVVYGDDIPYQIAEFSRLSGVTKVVIGRSAAVKGRIFPKQTLVENLLEYAPQLDVHIIPDSGENSRPYRERKKRNSYQGPSGVCTDILICTGIMIIASIIGMIFHRWNFEEANIIMIYVLGVTVISVTTRRRIYGLISSIFSVLIFNFLFTEPLYSLQAYDPGYPVTFFIMFLTAFLTSTLAAKIKNHAKQSAIAAFRTKILLDTSQALQQADDREQIMEITANQIIKLMKKDVITYCIENGKLLEPSVYYADSEEKSEDYLTQKERAVATWVLKNNKHAGATTQTLSDSKCLYLSVRVNRNVYGIIGIAVGDDTFEATEKSVVLSILGECALALENDKNEREKEEAAVLAKNEQLRANLLRAISHDLRTPLTSISGNASNFLSNGDSLDEETKKQLFTDIYDDSMWLINLVENLLSVTRLEDDSLNLNLTSELIADVIDEAMKHISRKKVNHKIRVLYEDEFLLARMDARLIVQVIINIVDNAIKYTDDDSEIVVSVGRNGNMAEISIADNGEGIPDSMKPRIFDMFYSGANKVADSRRSLGLGLSLCKSIVNAHGGVISVKDNVPHGTVFTFTLPMGEVTIHE